MASLVSPWAYTTTDISGNNLSVTFTFDNVLFTILTVSTSKDASCAYNNFYVGLGTDGTPNSTSSQIAVAQGSNLVGVSVFNAFGFSTINDVLAHQITAGP